MESKLSHFLLTPLILCHHSESHISSHRCRYSHIIACILLGESAIGHGETNLIVWHTWHTHTDRVLVTRIKHVHHCGTYCCRRFYHRIWLRELTADGLSISILHEKIASQCELTSRTAHRFVTSVGRLEQGVAHINLRALSSVHSGHNDLSRESSTTNNRLCIWNHIGVNLVHTYIFHINIGHQLV